MIIKKLVLHNFGVYASTSIFEFQGEKPIVLIGGMNGRGKTTFLEAVLLVLYGSNSFAYIESKYRSFGQYLKSYVNMSDGTMLTYIDMEFYMDIKRGESYRIRREWKGNKTKVTDTISVYKNGEYNQFLTDNWTMFIENILPSGLSNFFFFDGEKIAELAVENTSNQMKDSIKTLLGISVLDLLESDLARIINRISKNKMGNSEAKELEDLKEKRNKAEEKLQAIDTNISALEESKSDLEQDLEELKREYASKGGNIVTQRQELFSRRSKMTSQIEHLKEQLVLDASSELPFVLVRDQLHNIRESAEIEQDEKMMGIAMRKLEILAKEYEKSTLDYGKISEFMEFVSKKSKKSNIKWSHNLSDTSLFKLKVLLDKQLLDTKFAIQDRKKDLSRCQKEATQLDSYLSVDIDEKAINKIYKSIKIREQRIIDLDVKLAKKCEERRNKNGEYISINSEFNKRVESYLKKVELNDDSDRILKYSHMANTILEEYKNRLQKDKSTIVADTMESCYKKLANKKSLIEKIEMNPETLDLTYLNAQGEEVNKSSLSAGEKQLMVIALLWALALCSKKKLPVIIDTPLSRLDSAHRNALIKTYFPQASEQTIILSTDSEIDMNYYKKMQNDIGDEYTLIYDDASKPTSIKKGYFMEVDK